MFTLKAFEIVEDILSRIKPPAKVPKIPQTIVIPPNNKSALLCQKKIVKEVHSYQQCWNCTKVKR